MPPFAWLLAITASAAACMAAATGALPAALVYVFKPLTTLLVIATAWRRDDGGRPALRRRVLLGLWLSLAGDVFLLWPKEGFLAGLVAFLLAHLAYIAAFSVPVRFGARPWAYAVYAVIAGLILSQLWAGVPSALRLPVIAYVLCLASMAAQAAVWWRVVPAQPHARNAALGGALFMASDSLLALNKFGSPLWLAPIWILGTYWLAQWCIARSLPARRAVTAS